MPVVFEGLQQVFQSIKFDFVECSDELSEFASRPSFLMKPNEIGFGKVAEYPPFVFSKRHLHGNEVLEQLRIHNTDL